MKNHSSDPQVPQVCRSETVYKGFFNVRIDDLTLPNVSPLSYAVLETFTHAAAVLAKTKEGLFVINREYRHPAKKWLLGCPGGRIDGEESPIEAARRELLEETGYGGGTFSLLGTVHPFPAVTNQQIYYIYAEGVEWVQPTLHESFELIHTELKTEEELRTAIATGAPVDGVLCTALLLLKVCC